MEEEWVELRIQVLRDRGARLAALAESGVQIEDPATTLVGPEVVVEAGAVLRCGTILEGRTTVGAGARIGPWVRLVDTTVGEDATILDHCVVTEALVEAGASVGPFSHVRPGSHIGRRARVGNFVELKKTSLGEGSKASHLSYLGDATIGASVNIGAGTITCNYDGAAKHPTTIEDGAFIGSDSILVAPLRVGTGAYVAAGSTLTADVPAEALGIARARQENKTDWVRRRKGLPGLKKSGG